MLGSLIPDLVVMRYVDDELPWLLWIPVRAAVLLSPRLRRRVRTWQRISDIVKELSAGAREIFPRPGPPLVTEDLEGMLPADQRTRDSSVQVRGPAD